MNNEGGTMEGLLERVSGGGSEDTTSKQFAVIYAANAETPTGSIISIFK